MFVTVPQPQLLTIWNFQPRESSIGVRDYIHRVKGLFTPDVNAIIDWPRWAVERVPVVFRTVADEEKIKVCTRTYEINRCEFVPNNRIFME